MEKGRRNVRDRTCSREDIVMTKYGEVTTRIRTDIVARRLEVALGIEAVASQLETCLALGPEATVAARG